MSFRRVLAGFTRIELSVALVMVAILATIAVPRFKGYETEARVTAVKNLGGALKSAALRAHEACLAQSCVDNQVLVIEGKSITFLGGYPNAASIHALLESTEGFTVSEGGNRFTRNGAAGCWVQYNGATVSGDVVTAPQITYRLGAITDAASEKNINADLRAQC
jgi:prepilin-type N-terminal cleavage/methylation domain-containing protein